MTELATNSARVTSLSFDELLLLNEAETRRWRKWFEKQDASVLDLPNSTANAGTVRGLLLHISAVELRHGERLLEKPEITTYESLPTGSVASLFAIGDKARQNLRGYLQNATEQDLRRVIDIHTRSAGTLRASKRKLVAHIFFHSIRHWAQLASALREHSFATDWPHDVLMMPEFE
jgi:uncharacterized damage-inducible protein DinB